MELILNGLGTEHMHLCPIYHIFDKVIQKETKWLTFNCNLYAVDIICV